MVHSGQPRVHTAHDGLANHCAMSSASFICVTSTHYCFPSVTTEESQLARRVRGGSWWQQRRVWMGCEVFRSLKRICSTIY